jgi:hypothetical protein
MCANLMDLDHVAQQNGWYGWSEGAHDGDMVVYRCGCPNEHTLYVAPAADDVEYYEQRAAFVRSCST